MVYVYFGNNFESFESGFFCFMGVLTLNPFFFPLPFFTGGRKGLR